MKRIFNQRGSALMASLIASVLVVSAGGVAYKNFNVNHDSVRVARIKSLMNLVEAQVRRRALQPESYVDCGTVTGAGTCSIRPGLFDDLNDKNVSGAQCAGGQGVRCGVRVELPNLDRGLKRFSARVSYYGNEAKLRPIDVVIQVPTEVLQAEIFTCPNEAPFFLGFTPAGAPDCQPFRDNPTFQGGACISGHFVKRINVSERTVECAPLPPMVQCGDQNSEKFAKLGWVNGVPTYECANLDDPPLTRYRNLRIPTLGPAPTETPPVINATSTQLTQTVTNSRTETFTYTHVNVSEPPPPPGPICGPEIVYVGVGGGATPRYWGNYACTQSCRIYSASAMCVSNCQSGYRGWMYCYDCRDHQIVCR
ncbi:MAG: hypothetical protein EOP11_07585 [Proteobacteria bacterium]|nr:MAG: hypothetical protein EOP11_07585 [Pseudomonadota bacterium]